MSKHVNYVNVIQYLDDIIDNYQDLMGEAELLGRQSAIELAEDLDGLKSLLEDPNIAGEIDNLVLPNLEKDNPIDTYKVGDKVIELYGIRYSEVEIAQALSATKGYNFTPEHVVDWIDNYKNSSLTVRAKKYSISKMEGETVYDEMATQLKALIEEIKIEDEEIFAASRTNKYSALTEVIRELRMWFKQYEDYKSSSIDVMACIDPIIEAILSVLKDKVPPTVFNDVLNAIKDLNMFGDTLI
jgi:hypothetical protein